MSLKFWKKTEVKNASEADPEMTEVEVNGKTHKLNEVIDILEEKEKENASCDDKNEHVNMDEKHKVGDEELTTGEIIERFQALNMDDEEDHENMDDEDEDHENMDHEEEEKENAVAKKELQEMKNAIAKGGRSNSRPVVETFRTKANRGKTRYGSNQ